MNVVRFFATAATPLLVLLIGIIAKFALLDGHVPSGHEYEYFRANYAKDIWLQLLIVSYIAGLGWYFADGTVRWKAGFFIITPTVCFFVSLLFVQAIPKIESIPATDLLTIWIPAVIGIICAGAAANVARR